MIAGSRDPNSPTDQQCTHCGLYFSARGINSHTENCGLQEFGVTLQPIAGSEEVGEDPETSMGDPPTEPTDGVEGNPIPHSEEEIAPAVEPATDGGRAVEPPTPAREARADGGADDADDDHLRPIAEYFTDFEHANPQTARTDDYLAWKSEMMGKHEFVDVEATTETEVVFQ